ncbi:MAG: hypothetical protein AAGE93_05250 [Bacteroidota bacterium]
MKSIISKLNYLFVSLFLLLAACTDEEDPNHRDLLIGTWEIQSGELADYQVTVEGVQFNKDNIGTIALIVPQANEIIEALEEGADILFPSGTLISFNEDNSFTLNDQTEVTNGTWALSDDEETITIQANNDLGINQLGFIIRSLTNQAIDVALQIDDNDLDLENLSGGELPIDIESFVIEYNFNFSKQQ